MNISDKILSLKETTKAKIAHALKNNRTEIVVAAAKELDLLDRLERQYKEIETAITSFDKQRNFNADEPQNINKSPKRIGKDERKIFIQEAFKRKKILSEEKGPLCRDKSDGLVGIAYASERNRNRWFLGLPKKEYSSIVFICKNNLLKIIYFILPCTFCERYQNDFDIDEKEIQYKFNIALKKDGRYILTMSSKTLAINDYIDRFDNIG